MKVLFVTTLYPSKATPLCGMFVKELVLALRHKGVDLRVMYLFSVLFWPFTLLRRYRQWKNDSIVDNSPWLSYQKTPILPGAFGSLFFAWVLKPLIARKLKKAWPDFKPDVVHAQTFITGGVVGEYLARAYNCPLVITSHGADTRVAIKRPLAKRVILSLCKKARSVICVGPAIRESLIKNGASPDNVQVIYNGMDLRKVHSGPNLRAREFEGKRVILGVGNLKATKGYDLLIEAIRRLRPTYPNLHGIIVGAGEEDARLKEQVSRANLSECMSFMGEKPPTETMEYMDCCEVFCLPSWSEGFGIVYLEAMAHGKPVIAVDGQGITDVVRGSQSGILVKPHDADAVTDAIKTLLDNPQEARQMGERGKALVYGEFSWDMNAEKLLELYRQ